MMRGFSPLSVVVEGQTSLNPVKSFLYRTLGLKLDRENKQGKANSSITNMGDEKRVRDINLIRISGHEQRFTIFHPGWKKKRQL